jgi:hypothetical protein
MDDKTLSDVLIAALRAEGVSEVKALAVAARFWQLMQAVSGPLFKRGNSA